MTVFHILLIIPVLAFAFVELGWQLGLGAIGAFMTGAVIGIFREIIKKYRMVV